MIVGDAGVEIRPEADNFAEDAAGQIEPGIGRLATRVGGLMAAAFAGEKVAEFLKGSVEQASDLSESASKVSVVFGQNADAVKAYAATASTALGQSNAQVLDSVGTFGNLLSSLGLTADQTTDMSLQFSTLASDLASFNNTDPAEALDALRSGLIGETDPLKQYGVNLNQAAIQQEAVRLGLAKQGDQLDASTQAQAAYSLIMQQTTLAQGDFARTSGGLANQTRIIAAQFTDLKGNVGGLLYPFVQLGATVISGTVMPALLELTSHLPELGASMGALGPIFRAAFSGDDDQVTALLNSTLGLGNGLDAVAADAGNLAAIFGEAFADGKAGADLLAEDSLAGLAARAGVAGHQIEQDLVGAFMSVRAEVEPLIAPLASNLAVTFASVKAAIGSIFDGLGSGGTGGGLAGFAAMIGGALNAITPLISGFIGHYVTLFTAMLPAITDVITGILPIVTNLIGQIGPVLQTLLPILAQLSGIYLQTIVTLITSLTPIIPTLVSALGQVVQVLATGLLQVLTALAPVIPVVVGTIGQLAGVLGGALVSVIGALAPVLPVLATAIAQIAAVLAGVLAAALGAILPILPDLANLLATVATMLAGALAGALQAVLPILPPIVAALGQVATVLVGALMQALRAIMPLIPLLVGVLLQLVTSALTPLLPILPLLANLLATVISALAPLIPVIVQVVVLLVQLAVAAIVPLLPVVTVLANLITILIAVLVPIIQVLVTIAGAFIGLAATILTVVIGVVSTVVGIWTGLITTVASIYASIFGVIRGVFTSIATFVSGVVSNIAGSISGAFSGVVGAISGMFSGISGAVSGAFSGAAGIVKGAVNGIISAINGAIGGLNNMIDTANKVPFVNIPHIGTIPRLHSGGYYDSGSTAGEGLALLRDGELVVTPEQQASAQIIAPRIATPATPAPAALTSTAPTVHVEVYPAAGTNVSALAAQVGQEVGWKLSTRSSTVPLLGSTT